MEDLVCLVYLKLLSVVILRQEPGGGGTPIHYLYGYVQPHGVVILKLLI